MHRTRPRAAVLVTVVAASVAACGALPRAARAQSTTLVETLPRSNDTMPPGPFDMAPPNMRAARRLTGCYSLTVGPWSNPQAYGGRIPVPSRLDLLSDPHTRFYLGFRLVARTPGFADQLEKFPPGWSPIGDDSLQVRAWSDGSSSLMLFLRRRRDGDLRGTARYFGSEWVVDSVTGRWLWETYPAAPAALHPTQCE